MFVSRLFLVLLPLACTAARADVISHGDIEFVSFVIDSSGPGIAVIAPGAISSTFGQALDSTGGFQQASDSGFSALSVATTAFAQGDAQLDETFGLAEARVALPNQFNGFASAEGQATLTGNIDVSGAPSVPTLFFIDFEGGQSLMTSGTGQAASQELIFTLSVPDVQSTPILSYDNLLTIGPNQTAVQCVIPSLSTTLSLAPGTYPFTLTLDSESFGASTPEPASLVLAGTAAVMAAALFRRARRRASDNSRS